MLAASADRLGEALEGLDPGSRALLDLSLRQGVSDSEIGELLGKPADQVAQGRDDVLELLADALDVDGYDRRTRVRAALLELPDAAWQGRRPPPAAPAPAFRPRVRDRRERRFDPRVLLALAGVVAAAALVTIVLVAGGEEGDEGEGPGAGGDRTATQPAPPGGAADGGRTVPLEPLPGRRGRGTATLSEDGERLAISISGLPEPEGAYEIWLYSSVVDSRSLGSFRQRRVELDARLPDDPRDYSWIDVSHEPADGNPNHSGESVMRVPVEDLVQE